MTNKSQKPSLVWRKYLEEKNSLSVTLKTLLSYGFVRLEKKGVALNPWRYLPVILRVTWVLPAFSSPNHIAVYAHLWAELVADRSLELFRVNTDFDIQIKQEFICKFEPKAA